jgi:N-acetylmuramoyl-L-alanine amidase
MNAATGTATGTETFYRDSADKVWARKVQDAALAAWGLRDRGLKTEADSQHSRLAVFDFDGRAALLEVGFIDNPLDRGRAQDRDRRIAFWAGLLDNLTTPRSEL